MLGLRNVFFNQICLNRMPVSKNNIRNRIRLSCFLDANSKNYSLSNNKLHFSFLTVENVRHFSFFDHKYYRFIKGKINNLNFLNRKKDVELGMFLYQSLEHVHFKEFYTHLKMSDTYRSWFMVSELHVWMLLVCSLFLIIAPKAGNPVGNMLLTLFGFSCPLYQFVYSVVKPV